MTWPWPGAALLGAGCALMAAGVRRGRTDAALAGSAAMFLGSWLLGRDPWPGAAWSLVATGAAAATAAGLAARALSRRR